MVLGSIIVACGEAEHHGNTSVWCSKVAHLLATGKQRQRESDRKEGKRGKIHPSKECPQ
jgi:hypothetical protein